MKKCNLICDLDGILIDSEKEVLGALKKAASDVGLREDDMIYPFLSGPTVDNIFRRSFPSDKLAGEVLGKAVAAFRKNYDLSDFIDTNAFPCMDAIIHNTNDFTHYVITNKPDLASKKILERLDWTDCITRLVTPYTFNKMGGKKMEKSELFMRLIQEEMLDKSRTLGIGDMASDCEAAHFVGIQAIGVLWGTGTVEELQRCDFLYGNPKEMVAYFDSKKK